MFERYADFEYLLAQIQLVLFMLGMGVMLQPARFRRDRPPAGLPHSRGGAAIPACSRPGRGTQCLFWPAPGVAIGLIIVAAMPGGQMSKLFTYLARQCGTVGRPDCVRHPGLAGHRAPAARFAGRRVSS